MDFYAVLDQVVDLLRHRGRVTYGALQLQFDLGDEQLAVLKEELIDAQQLARDEEGRILVGRGAGATLAPATPSPRRPADRQADLPAEMTPRPERACPTKNAGSSRCCSVT